MVDMNNRIQDFIFGLFVGASGIVVCKYLFGILRIKSKKPFIKKEQSSACSETTLYHSPKAINSNEASTLERIISSAEKYDPEVSNQLDNTNLKESESVLNLLFTIGEYQTKRENITHRGISCNICNTNPLNGIRFKCLNCVDYDVCWKCEPRCEHDITHVFLKISIPLPPLANPRSSLLQSFYPGKKGVVDHDLPWTETMKLREESHFGAPYIELLYDQYRSLCTSEKGITKDVFSTCLGPLTTKRNLVVEQLFQFYDRDSDGYISFPDFVLGMSVMARGSKAERIEYVFKGYDLNNDGFISRDDLLEMLKAYHQLSMELVRDVVRSCEEEMMATYDDVGNRPISAVFNAPIPDVSNTAVLKSRRGDSYNSLNGMTNGLGDKSNKFHDRSSAVEAMTQDAITELVEQIMKNADLDKDGLISQQEFYTYVLTDTSLLAWFEAVDTVF